MKSNFRTIVTLVAIGTICWLVAATVAVALNLDAKIIWTCVLGATLGATGIRYTIRRNKGSGI